MECYFCQDMVSEHNLCKLVGVGNAGERVCCSDCLDEVFDFFHSGKADKIKENNGKQIQPKLNLGVRGHQFISVDEIGKIHHVFDNMEIRQIQSNHHRYGGPPETEIYAVQTDSRERQYFRQRQRHDDPLGLLRY